MIPHRIPRPATRFGAIALLMITLLLALISFWVLEVMRRSGEGEGPQKKRVEPDYFAENFTFLRVAETGKTRYVVKGRRMEHDPVDGTHRISAPETTSYADGVPPTHSRAQRAVTSADNSQVHLYGQVKIERPASPTTKRFELQSEYLLLLPDEDVMRSDRAVQITLGESVLRGVGMMASNAARQLQLDARVDVNLAPPDARR